MKSRWSWKDVFMTCLDVRGVFVLPSQNFFKSSIVNRPFENSFSDKGQRRFLKKGSACEALSANSFRCAKRVFAGVFVACIFARSFWKWRRTKLDGAKIYCTKIDGAKLDRAKIERVKIRGTKLIVQADWQPLKLFPSNHQGLCLFRKRWRWYAEKRQAVWRSPYGCYQSVFEARLVWFCRFWWEQSDRKQPLYQEGWAHPRHSF